jgi:hypothetical protein
VLRPGTGRIVAGMRSGTRRSAASVALLCAGVAVVAAGLATTHLAMVAAGVLVIVVGWLAAAGGNAPATPRDS